MGDQYYENKIKSLEYKIKIYKQLVEDLILDNPIHGINIYNKYKDQLE